MTGYLPQYELAAWSILRHLRSQTLESIRLGDTSAGRVDDFVILSTNAVDGHSVKWSEHRSTTTFHDLVKARDNAPCWVAQLADGWKRLCTTYPNRNVTVHLVTCDITSTSDTCPGSTGGSFASFYHEAWLPFQSDGREVPVAWRSAWEKLRQSSGLDVDEFFDFAKACQLHFNVRTSTDRVFASADDVLHDSQLKTLAAELANIVRDPSRQIEFKRSELLARLGWSNLFEFRHQHDFPVRDPYEPIDATVQELNTKLSLLTGGYVAVLGSPGAGKSTLLTRTLEAGLARHRLVKYYAYVPGSSDPRTRGESENFLHDLVLSLEHAGFAEGQSQGEFDRLVLLERLGKQLRKLGDAFQTSHFPTIILIDGLDHIPREQNPERSLISDLPLPSQIPDGVYFVLGSQTDDLPGLPPAVLQSLRQPERRIEMARMSKDAVLSVLAAAQLPVSLDEKQQETLLSRVGGHPLALSLLLNRLKVHQDANGVSAILSDTTAFAGDINEYFFSYWHALESDPLLHPLAELMGLLARLRRPIDLDWVASWTPAPPLAELRRRFGHFFRAESPDQWEFFHNSFRQYVLVKSAARGNGNGKAADQNYHRQLASLCERSDEPHSWEQVYHLAMAGDAARVLTLATVEYFRKQLDALRPLASITRDARYVAWAAGEQKELSMLVTMALFLSELTQRAFTLDAWKIGNLLLTTGNVAEACEYLWENNELQIGRAEALRAARELYCQGHHSLARRVFEAAEPLTLIQPSGEAQESLDRNASALLQAWAEAAPLFRPVDELSGLIAGFVPPKPRGEPADSNAWRATLFFWAAYSMERIGRIKDAGVLETRLKEHEPGGGHLSVWLAIHRFRSLERNGQTAEAQAIVNELAQSPTLISLSDHAKLVIGQAVYSLLGNATCAADILRMVAQPPIALDAGDEPSFSDAMAFFRFYRLLVMTGADVSPSAIVPDPDKPQDWPQVHLQRSLIHLAIASASAARGSFYTAADVRQVLYNPLRLFFKPLKETRRWHNWYRVQGLREDFDKLLVSVVREHGKDAIDGLRAEYEMMWTDSASAPAWQSATRRNIVMALYDAGVSEDWTRAQLETISTAMLDGRDLSGKVDECEAQAKAWNRLGDDARSLDELRRMVSVSFGVGYRKDYQMDEWVKWLGRVIHDDATKLGERIALFAAAIAGTEETTEGRGTRTAALALVQICATASPRRAAALIRWFGEHGCLHHEEAIGVFLQAALDNKLCRPSIVKTAYLHFLLPFATETHAALSQTILTTCSTGISRTDAASLCRQIVDAVNTRALCTARPFVLRALEKTANDLGLSPSECGFVSTASAACDDNGYDHQLSLKDGTVLAKRDILTRASSVDGLIELINQASGYYQWEHLFLAMLPRCSRPDVLKLARGLPATFDRSLALSATSRRLSELGDRDAAWQLAERALKASPTYGWAKHFDGGTRLEAIRALVTARPTLGQQVAIKEVASNLSSATSTPFDIAQCLLEIIPLLDSSLKPEGFYQHVEEYVKLLSAPLELLADATATMNPAPEDDTFERALCDMLIFHMVGLIPSLAQAATKTMAHLVLNRSVAAERAINGMLAGNEKEQVAAVSLLEVLAPRDLHALRPFSEQLSRLVVSRHWWMSNTAQRLCGELGIVTLPRAFVPLPQVYNMVLPPTDDESAQIESGEPLPETDNPRDLVRPYGYIIDFIAKMTGLDDELLFAVTALEMRKMATTTQLSAQGERDYKSQLERAGLKLPFRRPRGAIAREAIRRIASDLVDGRCVRPDHEPFLLELLSFADPQLVLCEPTHRPVEIKALNGLNEHHSNVAEWAANERPSFAHHVRKVQEKVVLAETTTIKSLDWSAPTEARSSVVAENTLEMLDSTKLFERVIDVRVEGYAKATIPDSRRGSRTRAVPIIIRNQWLGADTEGVDWIALNPAVGKVLGWVLSNDGLFRWTDSTGEIMVETIWWKDGCLELPPYERDCEVAAGFLVVASERAASELFKRLKKPTRTLAVQRSYISDGQPHTFASVHYREFIAAQER